MHERDGLNKLSNIFHFGAYRRYGFTVASNITVFILAWQTFGFEKGAAIDEDDQSNFQVSLSC